MSLEFLPPIAQSQVLPGRSVYMPQKVTFPVLPLWWGHLTCSDTCICYNW